MKFLKRQKQTGVAQSCSDFPEVLLSGLFASLSERNLKIVSFKNGKFVNPFHPSA